MSSGVWTSYGFPSISDVKEGFLLPPTCEWDSDWKIAMDSYR